MVSFTDATDAEVAQYNPKNIDTIGGAEYLIGEREQLIGLYGT